MRCPKCQTLMPENAAACPACGHDVALYRSFLEMKQNAATLKNDAFALFKQFDLLQQRFTQFEELLTETKETGAISFDIEEIADTPEKQPTPEVSEKPTPKATISLKEPRPTSPPSSAKTTQEKQQSEITFGQKWLLIAGVIVTVLGVGWFLKYSFDQNWIGPAGRVALAYLGGIIFLGGGELFRRKDFDIFGLYLIGGGIAILYFATFAAFQIYHLIPQSLAFLVMILITTLAGILALVYDTKWLVVLGLIGGFLTPVILSTGQDNQFVLMSYMTILNAGILSIAFFKQWRLLNYLGFFFTWLLFTGWMFAHYNESKFWMTFIFLNIFFLTYAVSPFAYHLVKGHGKRLSGLRIIVPNSFIGLGYSYILIEEHFQVEYVSIVTLVYAAIFLWMAQFIYRRNREQIGAFVMLLAEAMIFLVITIPLLFSQHWITVFWAIQATVLLWAAVKLDNKWLYGSFSVLLALTLAKFFWYDYPEIFDLRLPDMSFWPGYLHRLLERFITSGTVLAALLLSALMVTRSSNRKSGFQQAALPVLWGGFIIALFLVLNVETAAYFHDYGSQARFAAISVLWTMFSLLMMIFGFSFNLSILRKAAIALFAVTMLKVFLLDMANVSTPYRVVSFLVLGLMLIGASYLYHRFKERILPPEE
ncbi:membrane protein [Candidatus Vecturithrix granuli]|uniref:Membrane protein n=1 Tax=Vecturithrix granuli TaxID=1499967 RepID=A0A0S6W7H9_VECG1|nr:membrane protein [Candidatus Vecturithrix granuli]